MVIVSLEERNDNSNAKDDECAIRDIECATETVGDSEITKEVEESEEETVSKSLSAREEIHRPDAEQDKSSSLAGEAEGETLSESLTAGEEIDSNKPDVEQGESSLLAGDKSQNEMDFVSGLPRRQLFWEGN